MTDVYSLILKELNAAECCHVDRFPPFYNCSIGAHLLNLHNKKEHVYFVGRRVEDLRNHIMFVAPPGGEKTFWQEQYLRGVQALLKDTKVDTVMKGAMTEAGFVGTKRFEGGQTIEKPGICRRHHQAIVGVEEFSAVADMLKQEHSKALDPAMLGALDSGWVYKDLAAGPIAYETFLTLWVGTQPARFDLRGGMARRFIFIYFIPTPADMKQIKEARRRAKNKRFNPVQTDRIRAEITKLKLQVRNINRITFSQEVYNFYDKHKFVHWEEQLYDHLLMGYLIMRGKFDHELYVELDSIVERLLIREAHYRDTIRRGSEYAEVILIMREHEGSMGEFVLMDELLTFGKDWKQSKTLISELIRMRVLKRVNGSIQLSPALREKKMR